MIRRTRRLRRSTALRDSLAETRLHAEALIQPHFIVEGHGLEAQIDAMPGISRTSVDRLVERVRKDLDLGLSNVLLFGLPQHKDGQGSAATTNDGLVPRAVRALRDAFAERLTIITDVCLCAYTDHGHCGVLHEGHVVNDDTLPILSAMAAAHARAGADIVAPSDMMDGRVAHMRGVLDQSGFKETAILSYSTKFASGFYGPFREAADCAPKSGDRRSYQMDPRNGREAVLESLIDEEEGADMLMVKPALAYLDVIAALRARTLLPIAAYNVSGEYSMVKAAAQRGWIDEARVVREVLWGLTRAGADLLITYHGREALGKGWLA